MRVVQINSHFGKGGAGKIAKYLHEEMTADGINITTIYGRDSGLLNDTANIIRVGSNITNAIDAILTRITGLVGYFSNAPTAKAIDTIEKIQPDLVHLHVLHGYYINQIRLLKYLTKKKIPVVWTFHDCNVFTGKCGYSYECEKYKKECGQCPYISDYPKSLFFDRTRRMLKEKQEYVSKLSTLIVVSPCDWMTNLAADSYLCGRECITINNGIETGSAFRYRDKDKCRKDLKLPDGPIALGVAYGQEDPRKGVKYIIEAAKELKQITFVLIGVSESGKPKFDEMSNVICRGFIHDNTELSQYYNAADVYLLPSLAENYATTVIESQACGTPVVGFNVGGVPEQLQDVFGTVVEMGNQECFNREILHYCLNPYEECQRKTLADMTDRRNSKHTMFQKYKDVYEKLIKRV